MDDLTESDLGELDRLHEIERLVRDLFILEGEYGALPARAMAIEDEQNEQWIERRLKELVRLPPSTEPEIQHQRVCPHPMAPCVCRRSHLLAEGRRLAAMIPGERKGGGVGPGAGPGAPTGA